MNLEFRKKEQFVGLAVCVVFLLAVQSGVMEELEYASYDAGMRFSARAAGGNTAVIAIDAESIAKLGDWPWPRGLYAELIEILAEAKPAVIGSTLAFTEARIDPGLAWINKLTDFYEASGLVNEVHRRDEKFGRYTGEIMALGAKLRHAQDALNTDKKLAASIKKAGNVALAMPFSLEPPRNSPAVMLPDYVLKNRLRKISDQFDTGEHGPQPRFASAITPPLFEFGNAARGVGVLPPANAVREGEPLVVHYHGQYLPSLALVLAAESLGLNPGDTDVRLGKGVRLGDLRVNTDEHLQMRPFFRHAGGSAFPVISFYDVFSGEVSAKEFRDKIVLIGITAANITQIPANGNKMPRVFSLAYTVDGILNENFIVVPKWTRWVQGSVYVCVAFYLILFLPFLRQKKATAVTLILVFAMFGTQFLLLAKYSLWLSFTLPALLVLAGHLALLVKQGWRHRGSFRLSHDAIEAHRLAGLAFQGQGRLEMAFEKFSLCPRDDLIMSLLYNLGLDFERKRQYKQAIAVYRYLGENDPEFRDIEQRTIRLNKMKKPRLEGGTGGSRSKSAWLESDELHKPTVGNYQIEKKLAKGAMGVVYLGTDPRRDRMVAIKTLALSHEFHGEELEDVTNRFFREANAAGRLKHPHIIAVYDAGEEHDLAYIAMEFFKGGDLAPYTKPDNLLPLDKLFEIIIKASEALDYAHLQGVVHRDIKPANILYNPATNAIKLTDFGIARITDTKKTKTGVILGTPSYMSPEQLAGKKVDGRADLFSLGVMVYQLLTGELPFTAESLASLMFKITNEKHSDILGLRADLPFSIREFLDTLLEKEPDRRYASGSAVAQALRDCQALAKPIAAKRPVTPQAIPSLSNTDATK
ncbi:MAG: CHASE2 domain-containing protein [Gammaproteobacteria bacterium]|nr:CHASE2 domain-containing protein [Gammaproteobacteria bacterium]